MIDKYLSAVQELYDKVNSELSNYKSSRLPLFGSAIIELVGPRPGEKGHLLSDGPLDLDSYTQALRNELEDDRKWVGSKEPDIVNFEPVSSHTIASSLVTTGAIVKETIGHKLTWTSTGEIFQPARERIELYAKLKAPLAKSGGPFLHEPIKKALKIPNILKCMESGVPVFRLHKSETFRDFWKNEMLAFIAYNWYLFDQYYDRPELIAKGNQYAKTGWKFGNVPTDRTELVKLLKHDEVYKEILAHFLSISIMKAWAYATGTAVKITAEAPHAIGIRAGRSDVDILSMLFENDMVTFVGETICRKVVGDCTGCISNAEGAREILGKGLIELMAQLYPTDGINHPWDHMATENLISVPHKIAAEQFGSEDCLLLLDFGLSVPLSGGKPITSGADQIFGCFIEIVMPGFRMAEKSSGTIDTRYSYIGAAKWVLEVARSIDPSATLDEEGDDLKLKVKTALANTIIDNLYPYCKMKSEDGMVCRHSGGIHVWVSPDEMYRIIPPRPFQTKASSSGDEEMRSGKLKFKAEELELGITTNVATMSRNDVDYLFKLFSAEGDPYLIKGKPIDVAHKSMNVELLKVQAKLGGHWAGEVIGQTEAFEEFAEEEVQSQSLA